MFNFRKILNTGSNVSSLPPEVLFSIFLRAIPPFTLLDTSLSSEHSTWSQALRLMHSIVIVCRGWYNVGVIFLYENICIRRRHQLECFRHTITSLAANKHLDLLVKSLTIRCHIPKNDFDFGKNLEIVLGRCTSMSTFSYDAPFVPPTQAITVLFPAYITHLRLDGHFRFDDVLPILGQLEETLLSLHFMIWDTNFEQSLNHQTPKSNFLSLTSLHSLSVAVRNQFEVLDTLRGQWNMPSLRRLTVSKYDFSNPRGEEHDYPMLQTSIISFLALFGRQMRQLHIGVNYFRFKPERFKELLKFCPRLERIIMHPATFLRKSWSDSNYFVHPRLRCIDLTHYFCHEGFYRSSELCLSKENLPSLECVRRFCNFPGDLRKWLDECSSSPDAEADQFSIDVFHQRLDFQDGLFIWRFEQDILEDEGERGGMFSGSFTVWEDDSDDGCYSQPSDDESSSSQDLDCEWTSADEDLSDW